MWSQAAVSKGDSVLQTDDNDPLASHYVLYWLLYISPNENRLQYVAQSHYEVRK